VRLGAPQLDAYLEFLAVRSRQNFAAMSSMPSTGGEH